MTTFDWMEIAGRMLTALAEGCSPTFAALGRELDIDAETLRVGMKREYGVAAGDIEQWFQDNIPNTEVLYAKVFSALKNKELTIGQLADKMDMSPRKIRAILNDMQSQGFAIDTKKSTATIKTTWNKEMLESRPKVLSEMVEDKIKFGVFSDTHFGSRHAQITAWIAYMTEAYKAGVRIFLFVGDLTCGIGGYRGQEHDMIPGLAPKTRLDNFESSMKLAELAIAYFNMLPFLHEIDIYMLGGNHDYWTITQAGYDVVKVVCDEFDNLHYLGYDEYDLPLTKELTARLWHPTGGIPYARSYRIQKGMENLAYQLLFEKAKDMPNNLGFIFAGHLHIEAKVQIGSVVGSQVPCFEGRTNYLKRKGLYPVIGAQVWEVEITGDGRIASSVYTLKLYEELHDDWKHYPQPEGREVIHDADDIEVVFVSK